MKRRFTKSISLWRREKIAVRNMFGVNDANLSMFGQVFILHIVPKCLLVLGSIRSLILRISIHYLVSLPEWSQLPQSIKDMSWNENHICCWSYFSMIFRQLLSRNNHGEVYVFLPVNLCLPKVRIMPSIRLNVSVYIVIPWYRVVVYFFEMHSIQYQNGLTTSMTYSIIVYSSCAVIGGKWSVYFGFLSLSRVHSRNWLAHSNNCNVQFHHVYTSIRGSNVICNVPIAESMNLFGEAGVSIIITARNPCHMKVSFSFFKMSGNTYFLSYLCYSWSHCWHLVACSIALFCSLWLLPISVVSFSPD